HCAGHPAAKDAILPIPDRHGLKVIDDNSHAHGSLHKGRVTGAFGDVTGASMMAGKSFAIGKAGMLTKNTPKISECAIACGHYERTGGASRYALSVPEVHGPLEVLSGEPAGGFKHRVNQTCSAPGRVQLRHNPERVAEIQRAMKRFGELLDRLPGLRAHRPPKQSGSTMGGWSAARGLHKADELGGLPLEKFRKAARDQDLEQCAPEANFPLRTHALFHHGDIFGHEGPTAAAFGRRGVRQGPESPPVAQRIHAFCFSVLRLSYDWTEAIEAPAEAFRKVVLNASLLLGKSRHPEAFPENLPKVFKSSTVSAA
ncbi:MAG: DegT/DnrJ/EryC1/StrS family aminotransferase, partial [Terrimicrobiaceae bacterium]|nr:DegT/DnrJ/EryC1/StrS family aminotransferase [Terrimicrobiaceae bacterium]